MTRRSLMKLLARRTQGLRLSRMRQRPRELIALRGVPATRLRDTFIKSGTNFP